MKRRVQSPLSVLRAEASRALIIDVTVSGLVYETFSGTSEEIAKLTQALQLHLPHCRNRPRVGSGTKVADGDPLTGIKELLSQYNMRDTVVILGFMSDPFHPFEGRFDTSLKILEALAERPPLQLVVQTRSPLIVIALPLLKGLGERACITVAFEALDDGVSLKFTPKLPRPSERIKTARALKRFGIAVTAQVAPLLPLRNIEKVSRDIAATLDDISTKIRLVALEQVGWRGESGEISPSGNSQGFLLKALQQIAPEKISLPFSNEKQLLSETLAA